MIRLRIPDMTCDGCARRVTRAVQALDPAARVQADPPAREARVESGADAGALLRALEAAGYPATLAEGG